MWETFLAKRLNARDAAALTASKVLELEARAKQDEIERRLLAAKARKMAKLWNTQASLLLQSAINKRNSVVIRNQLIDPSRLMKAGFEIYYIDYWGFENYKERQRIAEEENRKVLCARAETLRLVISKEKSDLFRLFKSHDRFKGMTITKENAVKHLSTKLDDYQQNITYRASEPNQLFDFIFDSKLYLFTPIESLRSKLQRIQDVLHSYEHINRDLPEQEEDSPSGFEEDEDINLESDSVSEEIELSRTIPKDFWRKISPNDCQESLHVKNSGDCFLIQWASEEYGESWDFDDLISAPALAWLADSYYGQDIIERVEAKIHEAINLALSSVQLAAIRSDENGWSCQLGDNESLFMPRPEELSIIFGALDYQVKTKDVGNNKTIIDITW
jgi:hypothetical protein